MKLVAERMENNVLYLELQGRIDASNAQETELQIQQCRQAHSGAPIILDAEKLQYISSAGLRVLLRLRKELAELKIINVNSEVYEILEMTGFTDLLIVEKAFRRLSLEGCDLIAAGANGRVYRYDEESIVKVYYNGATLEEIRREKDLCRTVFIKGINTAIPYDVVRVDDSYGSVAELLNASSLARLIREHPENMDQYADIYANLLKRIHETEVMPEEMPPMKESGVKWAQALEAHLPREQFDKLNAMMNALPEPLRMVHGDYHANNVMLQNDEPLLIDMDTVGYGHPIFDFAAICLAYDCFPELNPEMTMRFYKLPYASIKELGRLLFNKYFDGDEEKIRDVRNKALIIAHTRLLRRTMRRESGNTDQIARCKQHLAELLPLVDRLDY